MILEAPIVPLSRTFGFPRWYRPISIDGNITPTKTAMEVDCNEPQSLAFRDKLKADWQIHSDYRKILDRNDIDPVIVATGEFQRIRPCIEACMAGKDVCAEKPLSLYIQKGRALFNAARKTKRIVQVGTQQHSMERIRWRPDDQLGCPSR